MKILRLIVFLSATWYCKGQEDVVFTTIFTSKGKVFTGRSDNLSESIELYDFDRAVTNLAVYENYLYLSVRYKYRFIISDLNSAIWWVKLTNTTANGIDENSWEEFVVNSEGTDITSIAVVKEHIYVGLDDGTMWRCSSNETNKCKTINQLNSTITGLGYNPKDDKIYAILRSGTLTQCSPYNANDCGIVDFKGKQVSAMKIELDTFWLVVRVKLADQTSVVTSLIECPVLSVGTEFDESDCQLFEKLPDFWFDIGSIDAKGRYLYVNPSFTRNIYQADLSDNSTWYFNSVPENLVGWLDRFVIV